MLHHARQFCGQSLVRGNAVVSATVNPANLASAQIAVAQLPTPTLHTYVQQSCLSQPVDRKAKAKAGSDPPLRLDRLCAQSVSRYLQEGIALNTLLFSALRDSSVLLKAPDPLRRPLIFYYGHCAAFATTKLAEAGLCSNVDQILEPMFEKGVWELPGDDCRHADRFVWPSVDRVDEFVMECVQNLKSIVEKVEWGSEVVNWDSPLWLLFMAMEHDRIHFETSSVLIRQLPVCDVKRPRSWMYGPTCAPHKCDALDNAFVSLGAQNIVLGRERNDPYYGWCNEYGSLDVAVPSFACSKFLVTNADFSTFVHDGSYKCSEYWSAAGWEWVTSNNVCHPIFWVPAHLKDSAEVLSPQEVLSHEDVHGEYRYRAMFDCIGMPWDWPVEVNSHEAQAYCAWRSRKDQVHYRLPTEAEFHVWRGVGDGQRVGAVPTTTIQANVGFKYGSPCPVDWFEPCSTGVHDAVGNVWQHLSTEFKPLPGWKPHKLYPDFSEPHYTPQNLMALGGSKASIGEQSSEHYRLWWLRHFYQHMGFRLALSI